MRMNPEADGRRGGEAETKGGPVRIAVLPGDDAAPEAVYATLDVQRALDLPVEWVVLPDGETLAKTRTRAEAEALVREAADTCATLLFGASSGKTPGVGYLRWGKET